MARTPRAQETRAAEARPDFFDQKGRLEIDVSSLPVDSEPTWIRESIRGEYDDDNVQRAMERGFTPVQASDLASYTTHRLPGARGSTHQDDNLIRKGGLILMQRDRRLGEAERAAHNAETAEALRSVSREKSDLKDGRNFVDATPEVTVTTSRGGRFSE